MLSTVATISFGLHAIAAPSFLSVTEFVAALITAGFIWTVAYRWWTNFWAKAKCPYWPLTF
jgi:hypothetical protein